jgi:hypothetical protein
MAERYKERKAEKNKERLTAILNSTANEGVKELVNTMLSGGGYKTANKQVFDFLTAQTAVREKSAD